MKIEICEAKPEHFSEDWPGQYHVFSHLEFACGVPSVLFLITSLKENGKPNACLHAWSTFSGDSGGFFAILSGLMKSTHTYQNILRDGEFCVNFLSPDYYERCIGTIKHNNEDADELTIAGFTTEQARVVHPPRIREAFLTYECTLESYADLSGGGISAMIIGRVRHVAVDESHSSVDEVSGENGFMFNIHSPKDPKTGEGRQSAVAKLQVVTLPKE